MRSSTRLPPAPSNRSATATTQWQNSSFSLMKKRLVPGLIPLAKNSPCCRRSQRIALVMRFSRDLSSRQMQLFGAIHDPLRKHRCALRNFSQRDRHLFDPSRPFFTDVSVRQTVDQIAKSISQRYEPVTMLSQHIQQLTNVVCL